MLRSLIPVTVAMHDPGSRQLPIAQPNVLDILYRCFDPEPSKLLEYRSIDDLRTLPRS